MASFSVLLHVLSMLLVLTVRSSSFSFAASAHFRKTCGVSRLHRGTGASQLSVLEINDTTGIRGGYIENGGAGTTSPTLPKEEISGENRSNNRNNKESAVVESDEAREGAMCERLTRRDVHTTGLQRVLIHSEKTIQTFFSSYYNAPTSIRIVKSALSPGMTRTFDRAVTQWVKGRKYCDATSQIECKTESGKELYLSGGFGGLGQLMSRAGSLDCRFKLLDYGTDGEDIEVWREYILEDADFRVKVREDFVAGCFDFE